MNVIESAPIATASPASPIQIPVRRCGCEELPVGGVTIVPMTLKADAWLWLAVPCVGPICGSFAELTLAAGTPDGALRIARS